MANKSPSVDTATRVSNQQRSIPATGTPASDGERMEASESDKTIEVTHAPSDDVIAPVITGSDVAPGQVIGQRFHLERKLGEGGMGAVYLARDLTREEFEDRDPYVAVKLLSRRFAENPDCRIALQRETRKSQKLSHPNIVTVYDFAQEGRLVYMWMEYMRGLPLDEFIRKKARQGLPFEEALPIIRDMASGLSYIHEAGLVHADFKPGNVFLEESGACKILDLGIARVSDPANLAGGGTRFDARNLGALTPEYASCEMFEDQEIDPRDDIYALGCVTYKLLTGRHPFPDVDGKGIWAIKARSRGLTPQPVPGLNKRRWSALQKALAFDRDARTDSAGTFLEHIEDKRDFARIRMAFIGLTVVATAVIALLWNSARDSNDLFRENLLSQANHHDLTQQELAQVKNKLEFGKDLVGFAEETLAQGGKEGAVMADHDLTSGSSNAYSAFQGVLKLIPSPEAADGIMRIISLYEEGSRTLYEQGDSQASLWFACRGWQIYRLSTELTALINQYASAANSTSADPGTICGKIKPPKLDTSQ